MTDAQIRPLTADDDLAAQLELGSRAFGLIPPGAREGWLRRNAVTVAGGRYFAILDGNRQVGGAAFHDMRQWWAGQQVPLAGVGSVKVAPETRGHGLGRRLMTQVLREIAARGYPLSALYPATIPIYRSLGWELAGGLYQALVPTRSLRDLVPPDPSLVHNETSPRPLRQVTADGADEVIAVIGRAHQAARDRGPITWDVATVQDWILEYPDEYRYISADSFIAYRWEDGNDGLAVDCAVASTPAALRQQLALLAGHSSTAETVRFRTAPDGPLWWLLRDRDARLVKRMMWMLRVVDARAAVEQRGFGAAVSGSVLLEIADEVLSENAGAWRLTVEGGKGRLERAGAVPGALALGARGLAALYAGAPLATLRLAGLAVGGTLDDDAFLSAAFPGPSWILDDF